jgi:hypothetical protein
MQLLLTPPGDADLGKRQWTLTSALAEILITLILGGRAEDVSMYFSCTSLSRTKPEDVTSIPNGAPS